jgi:Uma2 family endonuclease
MSTTETLPQVTPTAPRPPLRMSYEEYKNWDHEGGLTEWVNGEVIFHALPNDGHQTIVETFSLLLGWFVELFKLGKVRIAPFSMRVLEGGNAREPDPAAALADVMGVEQMIPAFRGQA